jgi:hypothetical protein
MFCNVIETFILWLFKFKKLYKLLSMDSFYDSMKL